MFFELSKVRRAFREDKTVRIFLGFGLLGVLIGIALLFAPGAWLSFLGCGVGLGFLLFGIFRLFVRQFDYRGNVLIRSRFAVLLLALYALSVYLLMHFLHPHLDSVATKGIAQLMVFLCAALDLQMLIDPDAPV